MRTVAFPAISCGVYGFPVEKAAPIAVRETASFLAAHSVPEEVIFVCHDPVTAGVYERALEAVLSDGPSHD